MKLNKDKVTRRVNLLAEEGIEFVTNANIGVNVDIHDIKANNDALILCVGSSTHPLTHPLTHSPTHPLTHSPTCYKVLLCRVIYRSKVEN